VNWPGKADGINEFDRRTVSIDLIVNSAYIIIQTYSEDSDWHSQILLRLMHLKQRPGPRTEIYFFALSIRNYRVFWTGNLCSFFAGQMMQPTQAWLAYQITNSPLLLG